MKSEKRSIKKLIKKNIEIRQGVRLEIKKNIMNERQKLRNSGSLKPLKINLTQNNFRNNIRIGESYDVLPILFNKIPISIIITAYKTQNYIEECLDSIEKQTYFINNDEYEILIGVDACEETLNKLIKIKDKYRNISVFMMNSNMGTYVTSNTLIKETKYNYILRFDSDDIMKPEMINEIMYHKDNYDIIQFLFSVFTTNIQEVTNDFKYVAAGAHFYRKSVLNLAGGYRAWKCAADSEFIKRLKKFTTIKEIKKRLFYRRSHENSLTNELKTNVNSVIRNNYMKKIRVYELNEKIKLKPKYNLFKKY